MELLTDKLFEGINLHTIKDKKFKINSFNIYYQRLLQPNEVTLNALLTRVLQRGSKAFHNTNMIAKELEYLYGGSLFSSVAKKGEKQILLFSLNTISVEYVDDENLTENALVLLNDIIYNPIIDGNGFKNEYVRQEKENLEKKINSRLNDKNKYAIDRCVEEMCINENYRLYEEGTIEDLKNIDENLLYQHYKNIMHRSPIDIVVVGNIQHKKVKESILRKFKFKPDAIESIQFPPLIQQQGPIKDVYETMEISQGKLCLGYRTNVPYNHRLYPALMVYSSIIGGGPHSKLFIKVREERSLCYYIFSKLDKFKSLMLVSCGIDMNKAEETKEVISYTLQEVLNGEITKEEIDNAKGSIITAIKALEDNATSLVEYAYSQVIGNHFIYPQQLVENINNVTIDDIITVAANIQLDTVYMLGSK